MSPLRLLAILFIFCCSALAWFVLGISVDHRSGETDSRLAQEVAQLYGGTHTQVAPNGAILRPREVQENVVEKDSHGKETTRIVTKTVYDAVAIPLQSSNVQVDLRLKQVQKGLLWYNTYTVAFSGDYRLRNPDTAARTLEVHYLFPSREPSYDGFLFQLNGQDAPAAADAEPGTADSAETETHTGSGSMKSLVIPAGGEVAVHIAYSSNGMGVWTYALNSNGTDPVKDFQLVMKTNFKDIKFPAGTMPAPPETRVAQGGGWLLTWKFASLVTNQKIGMDTPSPVNPGPLAARISYFAPVSLLFFLTVMVILGALRGNSLHPMNYFFIAAAFFAFHLLLAYLVDHINLHAAFLTAAAVSVILVASYLRLVGGLRFALLTAAPAQLIFLVFFSYAFFFEGYTGLTVTVGAVVTLFALMQLTGKVEWGKVFSKKGVAEA
jgi:hypothetical protein